MPLTYLLIYCAVGLLEILFCTCVVAADVCPPVLCFRVKFYATDPLRLKEEITRSDMLQMCYFASDGSVR